MRFQTALKPSLLTKFVTLFVTLTALSGFAEVSPQGRVTKEDSAVTPYSAKQLEDHLASIDKLLGTLQAPTETQVTVGPLFDKSAFDRNSFKLYVGLKPDLNQIIVLSHEYGHAILEKNLFEHLEAYRQFKPLAASLSADRKEQKPGVDRTQKLYVISSALHEFFADVVAVTVHQNPQALREITLDPKRASIEGSWDDLVTRDFELAEDSPRQQAWEPLLPFASFTGEVYYALLPSRWEFWRLAKDHIHDEAYRATVLAKVQKAVEKVLGQVFQMNAQKLGGKKLEPAMMKLLNKKLIYQLRLELGSTAKQ